MITSTTGKAKVAINSKQPARPGAGHKRLNVFVGKWRAQGDSYGDGQQADDPRASAVPWTSEEIYEWLPGGFFLLHRWDAQAGQRVFNGTEIIGYDAAKGRYFTRFFDNGGNYLDYLAEVDGGVWIFSEARTRATVTVEKGGKRMSFNWEWRNGGRKWLPLCDRVASRVA